MPNSKPEHSSIDCKRSIEAHVFCHFDREGYFRLRPEFTDFLCKKCKRLNAIEALSNAVPEDLLDNIKLPNKDCFSTDDGMVLLTDKAKLALNNLLEGLVHFFPIPGQNHHIAIPNRLLKPEDDSNMFIMEHPMSPIPRTGVAYRSTGKSCRKCGLLRSCSLSVGWLNPPEDFLFGAAYIPWDHLTNPGCGYSWFAHRDIAKKIKSQVNGLTFTPFSKLRAESDRIAKKLGPTLDLLR